MSGEAGGGAFASNASGSGDPARVEGAAPPATTPKIPAVMNDSGHAAGSNTTAPAGSETERDAPGTSKDDRADGLR